MEHFAKIFFASIESFYDKESDTLKELFFEKLEKATEKRRTRVERVRDNLSKAELLMAEVLRDYAIKSVFGIEEPNITLGKDGKPLLTGETDKFFNVSHSGEMVVCAVSDTECGVDIEGTLHPHDLMNISNRFFSAAEQSAVIMSANPNEAFCRLWTIRESYVKMRGCGFSIGLTSLKCDFHRGKASITESGVPQTDAVFYEIKDIPNFRACLCTKGDVNVETEVLKAFPPLS